MNNTRKDEKKRNIRKAAYELLAEKGYKATSMLEIAKRASASNETLYRWYGNKQGLFREMVEENARQARELIEQALDENAPPLETLATLGPLLLKVVTSPGAIALNRAAAADIYETGTLGPTIAASGRNTVTGLIAQLLEAARKIGQISCDDPAAAAETYIDLLIGDIQIRCVIGAIKAPNGKEIKQRSQKALSSLRRISTSTRKYNEKL